MPGLVAIAQDPVDEEPWLYEPGGMGDFELCDFDHCSLPVTRSRPSASALLILPFVPSAWPRIGRLVWACKLSAVDAAIRSKFRLVRRRRQTIDPHTGRVTEVYANAAYCRLAGGATVVAHLAQVAARRLPEHVTHMDHLCRRGPPPLAPFVSLALQSFKFICWSWRMQALRNHPVCTYPVLRQDVSFPPVVLPLPPAHSFRPA